ncbi:MAG: penicillin-binding protein 1C, partial [Bacteroidales bacterium]|nr:penicillin-binding protein 1C [Bacteroidales bacterium]
VPASKALARSLNVPSVKMLQQYSGEKFINILKKLQISSVNKPADYYGLSLILGGCEASLWQLCGAYASMTRSLRNYVSSNNFYNPADYREPNYMYDYVAEASDANLTNHSFLTAGAIYHTLRALTTVERPEDEQSHEMFGSDRVVSWKTGTSFGFRDAWAIGVTDNYVVGVWTGNADGEGRPNIVGVKASAPILFDIVKILPRSSKQGIPVPYDDLTTAVVCRKSGHLAGENCVASDTVLIPVAGINTSVCPYCRIIHLDASEKYRVTADCESPDNIVHRRWFVLPPAMEYYYRQHNNDYRVLPPMRSDCILSMDGDLPIQIIYPEHNAKIFLPKGFEGDRQRMVLEATSRISGSRLFWHIDNDYIAATQNMHRISVDLAAGRHLVTITDQDGNRVSRWFEVVE